MRKILLVAIIALMSCSSDSDNDTKGCYYVKYIVTGGAWHRTPFGHTSTPENTTISFLNKNHTTEECRYSGKVSFSKVVGPVDKKFKPSLSAQGLNGNGYSASYEGSIEILKEGEKLVGSNSTTGSGSISLTCDIAE